MCQYVSITVLLNSEELNGRPESKEVEDHWFKHQSETWVIWVQFLAPS